MRRTQAQKEKRLYNTKRWRHPETGLRAIQLRKHPLCQCPHCEEGNIRTRAAEVVDHIVPHKGDAKLFYDSRNLQSLSASCHNRQKQSEEKGGSGFMRGCDENGNPISKEHWWNASEH